MQKFIKFYTLNNLMRKATERMNKYASKVAGDIIGGRYESVKKLSVQKERIALIEAEKVEKEVKVMIKEAGVLQIHFYIIFAKEILKAKRKHTTLTAKREICINYQKWVTRGLSSEYLNRLCLYYGGMGCKDYIAGLGIPWTSQTITYLAGDDGSYQKGLPTDRPIPLNRYTDNGDGTVTDEATTLTWAKDPSQIGGEWTQAVNTPKAHNWATYISMCEALSYGGKDDWRMPNMQELNSIIYFANKSPALDKTKWAHIENSQYWASTTYANDTLYAWLVDMFDGKSNKIIKSGVCYCIPVRGGEPV